MKQGVLRQSPSSHSPNATHSGFFSAATKYQKNTYAEKGGVGTDGERASSLPKGIPTLFLACSCDMSHYGQPSTQESHSRAQKNEDPVWP